MADITLTEAVGPRIFTDNKGLTTTEYKTFAQIVRFTTNVRLTAGDRPLTPLANCQPRIGVTPASLAPYMLGRK
jgi:hypothetical protein